jgi:fumarate hydratase class II
METPEVRIEKDAMGEVRVPAWALWAAQTQRAVENFPISNLRFGRWCRIFSSSFII